MGGVSRVAIILISVVLCSQLAAAQEGERILFTTKPESSPGTVSLQGAEGLNLSISPTTFRIQGPNEFFIFPNQTWRWAVANLTTLPDSFNVTATPSYLAPTQVTLVRPSIDVTGANFVPDNQGRFSFETESLSLRVASIQGSFLGTPITQNNLDLPIPPDQQPRINGQFFAADNEQIELDAQTLTSVAVRDVLRALNAPSPVLNAAGDGAINFNITLQAFGAYPVTPFAAPPSPDEFY